MRANVAMPTDKRLTESIHSGIYGRPPHFYLACGTIVALRKPRSGRLLAEEQTVARKIMKTSYRYCFQLVALFLRRHVRYKKPGRRIRSAAPTDTKDFGSHVRMITPKCGVGAYNHGNLHSAILCGTPKFTGDQRKMTARCRSGRLSHGRVCRGSEGTNWEKIAPARILKPGETARIGWLVDGEFDVVGWRQSVAGSF